MSFRFESDIKRYKIISKLGEGTYGKVYKASDKSSGALVALKISKIPMDEEGIPSCTIREICLLRSLKHPNIISLKDVVLNSSKIILIFDFLRSDLRAYLEKKFTIPEETLKKFLSQILKATHYCHSLRIMHRDLKPQNILIDFNSNLKIADFGLARNFQVPFRPYTNSVQTLWYRAPELLLGAKSYDTSIDMWSIGCIFAEMVSGSPPFGGSSELDVIYSIFKLLGTPTLEYWPGLSQCKNFRDNFPCWAKVTLSDVYTQISSDGLDLMQKLLEINPCKRITAFDAVNHVIFMQKYLSDVV